MIDGKNTEKLSCMSDKHLVRIYSFFLEKCKEHFLDPDFRIGFVGVLPDSAFSSSLFIHQLNISIRKFFTVIPEKRIVRPYIFQFCPSFHIRRVFIQVIDLCASHR